MLSLVIFVIPLLVLRLVNGAFRRIRGFISRSSVKGKVVVITGASSGLGRACAECFASAGAKVILCSRNEQELEKVKNEIIKRSKELNQYKKEDEPVFIRLDLSDIPSIETTAKAILDVHKHVDILINNAGMSFRGTILETTLETHQRLMAVNYFGPVALTKALLPSMVNRKTGHVVGVSSVQGKLSIPHRSPYSASKHAFQAFFDCLRAEVAMYGLKVTTVSPGYIRTNLSRNALTGDGSKHGVLDETTAQGMPPLMAAHGILDAVEMGDEDIVMADFKAIAAIYLRTLFPELMFKILKKRAKSQAVVKEKTS